MSTVREESIIYSVVSGSWKGKQCVIRRFEANSMVGVIFFAGGNDEIVSISKGVLAQLETPGWADTIHKIPYGIEEHFTNYEGSGINMLRAPHCAQPRALQPGDLLANGEKVVEPPRSGYNSSVLVRFDQTGWVELAARFPIAFRCNTKFKFPIELQKGDRLITGCRVFGKPSPMGKVGWVLIPLDREDCRIEIPSCIPLALA